MNNAVTNDPAEIMAQLPKGPTREQTLKTVQDKYPGHIAWATDRANFSGCRVITFTDESVYGLTDEDYATFDKQLEDSDPVSAEDMMNLYFSTRANLLVVNMYRSEEAITILVTTQLDAEDLEEFTEVQRRVDLEMRPWREQKALEREKAQDEVRENQRLLELGRKWEQHNLPGKIRELEAELAKYKKSGEVG